MIEIKDGLEKAIGSERNKNEALIIYALFLLAFIPYLSVLCLGAIIYAHIIRKSFVEWIATHVDFQIRTFWLCVAIVIGSSCFALLLMQILLKVLTEPNSALVVYVGVICMSPLIFLGIWSLIRLIKGVALLLREQEISNPKSWLFG